MGTIFRNVKKPSKQVVHINPQRVVSKTERVLVTDLSILGIKVIIIRFKKWFNRLTFNIL